MKALCKQRPGKQVLLPLGRSAPFICLSSHLFFFRLLYNVSHFQMFPGHLREGCQSCVCVRTRYRWSSRSWIFSVWFSVWESHQSKFLFNIHSDPRYLASHHLTSPHLKPQARFATEAWTKAPLILTPGPHLTSSVQRVNITTLSCRIKMKHTILPLSLRSWPQTCSTLTCLASLCLTTSDPMLLNTRHFIIFIIICLNNYVKTGEKMTITQPTCGV